MKERSSFESPVGWRSRVLEVRTWWSQGVPEVRTPSPDTGKKVAGAGVSGGVVARLPAECRSRLGHVALTAMRGQFWGPAVAWPVICDHVYIIAA